MLTREDRTRIHQHAYVPEHLPDYVSAVSGTEARLVGPYLCFFGKNHLTFIGYPLGKADVDLAVAFDRACDRFQPATASIVAPEIRLPEGSYEGGVTDQYYRLDLPLKQVGPDVAYMVRRAARELRVREGVFGREHQKIIKAFLAGRNLSEAQRQIFEKIPKYIKGSPTFRLLEARQGKTLAAFNIVDLGAARYAFYLFNFRATKVNVPGASDLLFQEMVHLAHKEGKAFLNLGLGVHEGIRRFKEKWGGEPFLAHTSALVQRKAPELDPLMKKL